ncbi:MAG TPA: hypothetical protein VHX19_06810, partial [Stellaceae bacterium]|nr:hypothetical protein [Stellaceae bacterium]
GAMKPKPFSALNHLTVPRAMLLKTLHSFDHRFGRCASFQEFPSRRLARRSYSVAKRSMASRSLLSGISNAR